MTTATRTRTTGTVAAREDRDRLLDMFLLSLEAENRSPNTLRLYEHGIRKLFSTLDQMGLSSLPIGSVSAEHLRHHLAGLRKVGLSDNTAQANHRALRAFWKHLSAEGEAENVAKRIAAPKLEEKVVEALSDAEIDRLFKALRRDRSTLGLRDLAICAALLDSGLRSGELLALKVGDIDKERRALIHGKGSRQRIVVFEARTVQLITRYHRRLNVSEGPLFSARTGGALSQAGLYLAVRRRGQQASIEGLFPHRLRHTTATALLEAGLAESDVRTIMGWSRQSNMLARYTASREAERALEARGRVRLLG